jgi:CheY-like chemotaxis protein
VIDHLWGLVVEDDAHNLIAVTELFKALGIHYKRNTNGAQVAGQVHMMRPRPDFILVSMDLAEGDPFAICQNIRYDPLLNAIPVIAMGSAACLPLQPQIKACGCAGFLLKPLPRKQFGQILERILAGESIWQEAV